MTRNQGFDHMLGSCPAMRGVFELIEKVAPTDLTVLILGETGTGKELVARSLHSRSQRSKGPFVAINCAALPSSLLESELFGFEKGSFTGAVASRVGHIESADGGTLFLDEIAELPFGAQSKLLRVLQDHRVQRLGSQRDRKVDLRVLAATHQDLPGLVEAGSFRRDLFHRLNQMQICLAPLRDREGDLDLIADAVLRRLSHDLGRDLQLSPAALDELRRQSWPGNVRELENCLQRTATASSRAILEVADLQFSTSTSPSRTLAEIVRQAQECAVRSSLRRHAGNLEASARELEIAVEELQELSRDFQIPLD